MKCEMLILDRGGHVQKRIIIDPSDYTTDDLLEAITQELREQVSFVLNGNFSITLTPFV